MANIPLQALLFIICFFFATSTNAFYSSRLSLSKCYVTSPSSYQKLLSISKAPSSNSILKPSRSSSTTTTTPLYMAKPRRSYNPGDFRKGNISIGNTGGGIGGGITRFWRRLKRSNRKKFSIQKLLVYINILMFVLQVRSAYLYLPVLNSVLSRSGGLPLDSVDVLLNSLWGSSPLIIKGPTPLVPRGTSNRIYALPSIVASSSGPLTMDFVHQVMLSRYQPHRYISSGFLHGSFIHLLLNVRYLWNMPSWLEFGLGWKLYTSAFLLSIVTGNLAHTFAATTYKGASTLVLGASGGICGLEGLMFASLRKMGNYDEAGKVFTNMSWLVLFGLMNDGVSNAGHIGGFIGGMLVGYLFGPGYGRSYGMRRKFSLASDNYSEEYRRVMRFGIEPDYKKGQIFPLSYLWGAVVLALLTLEQWRAIPGCIVKGFLEPGKLSGIRMSI